MTHKLATRTDYNNLPLDPDAAQPGIAARLPHRSLLLQIVVFLGGCFGTLARYGIGVVLPTHTGSFPYGTLIVNMLGSLCLGVLLQMLFHLGEDGGKRKIIRLSVGTGFIGAFTTYSSLAVESDLLITNHRVDLAITYALVSIIGGLLLSMAGIRFATYRHQTKQGSVA